MCEIVNLDLSSLLFPSYLTCYFCLFSCLTIEIEEADANGSLQSSSNQIQCDFINKVNINLKNIFFVQFLFTIVKYHDKFA